MEYDYYSRQKLVEDFKKTWENKLLSLDKKTKAQAEEMERGDYFTTQSAPMESAGEKLREGKFTTYSGLMKKHYKGLAELYAGENFIADYYYLIDKLNQFPYSEGFYRRTVRTKRYFPQMEHIFRLLKTYQVFRFFDCSVADYLHNRMTPEMLNYKRNPIYGFSMTCFDEIIAARIDGEDKEVIEAAKDLILGDNNTAAVTVELIRGIVKSSNRELHQLLADFLLAARLQEGVRQAVCENADCGTIEAFHTIFETICENGLIRFAAVKRAVATWTGICDLENVDRISEKMLELMRAALKDPAAAREYLKSNDTIQIAIGLWSLGAHEVQDAMDAMKVYLEQGTKNQLLTMSYFNRTLEWSQFTGMAAKEVFVKYQEDAEILAAFMPTYLKEAQEYAYDALNYNENRNREDKIYKEIPLSRMFESEEEARMHYGILKHLLDGMKKKKQEFYPCIFPWYGVTLSKTQIIKRMCLIAYMLKDSTCTEEMAEKLTLLDVGGNYTSRGIWVELLLHQPANEKQKELLISYIADKESSTRETAFRIADRLMLSGDHYRMLEGFLKYKRGDIRRNVLKLLEKQSDEDLRRSIKRLLSASLEEMRDGGLSLMLELKKAGRSDLLIRELSEEARALQKITEKEQILIDEICGESREMEEEGYGLYQPDLSVPCPDYQADGNSVKEYFQLDKRALDRILKKLAAFLDQNAELEYKNARGEEVLLGNGLDVTNYDAKIPLRDSYPFKELWMGFYEQEIKEPGMISLLLLLWYNKVEVYGGKIKRRDTLIDYERKILGKEFCDYRIPGRVYEKPVYSTIMYHIFTILHEIYEDKQEEKTALDLAYTIINEIPDEDIWYEVEKNKNQYYLSEENQEYAFTEIPAIRNMLEVLKDWKDDGAFTRSFYAFYQLDKKFDYDAHKKAKKNSYNRRNYTWLSIYDYLKACVLGLIPREMVYQAAFEEIGLSQALEDLSRLVEDNPTVYDKNCLKRFAPDGEPDPDNVFVKAGREIYTTITDKILDVELKRGEMPTVFSESIHSIKRIFGMEKLISILKAMGKEKLDRSTYYYWSGDRCGRKECFSYLLQNCYPDKEDNADKLRRLLSGSSISEGRLVETAMYAPQWLSIMEEYLGWPGFKSGCYYFMAHMDEWFDEKKKAMIARYTPLSAEELNNGAFDVAWFKEAYGLLGEERFGKLYDAAKYISDGSKHARARKYADAALGKVKMEDLEALIRDKRNKDLLMSYGLAPIRSKKDLLHRYEFIQEFLKESRQFGAQRRASEGTAASVALKNMATAAGYADVTRLTLAMESELIKTYPPFFEDQTADDVLLKIQLDENGKPEILCQKAGKSLKSVPARLKKNEYYVKLKEVHHKLKEQYKRTVKMLEQSMEDQEIYQYGELRLLCENPVIAPALCSLVFVTAGKEPANHGFLTKRGLRDCFDQENALKAKTEVRVAHPYDLYQTGCWQDYQKKLFSGAEAGKVIKQPFKQVFRELYVKLPEEMEKESSAMFAGNQIQPAKTAACLKQRRWVADYEEGLQKIYYKENLVAQIYALADWFSPSDIEAPTLEWVRFCDRKTFKSVKIKDIPDIVYSEVMRDVDMAVSVAHAGGVDPETSHSTIEMRKAVLEFGLPLFKISNVRLEGSHALIAGNRGSYSIHLGSGVIHQAGGPQIHVLPVHSQGRGKLFLPFLDEDPKTAEIISKIILFAEDKKLKDPYILDQIIPVE